MPTPGKEKSKKRRKWLITASAAAAVLGLLAWVPGWMVRVAAWISPRILWRVETQASLVAVTFDDGPDPTYTPQVLDLLKQHHARATFFLVGERARRYPELVARIRAEGHEIGNHTDSMRTTLYMSTERFEESMFRAEATLPLEEESRKFLRPAGGLIRSAQLRVAAGQGYTVVLGSAYAWDPARPPAAYIRWVIGKNLEPGVIVVLHDAGGNRSNTVAALDGVLRAGEEKGLRWVTVSELLAAQKR